MAKADLIKIVRGLDQTGPGDNGQHLDDLWNSLAAGSDRQFHAAEESSLRWLLKSMHGSSPTAETLRRFPLTWTILGRVIQRIPLFSLAKSLADRKFVSVLQQALKEISKPVVDADSQKSSKRKRSPQATFDLDDLRSTEASLETAARVFAALRILLERLDTASTSSHDRIGAEHLRSLFCTSATDAASTLSPALTICDNLLSSRLSEPVEGAHSWISTTAFIWSLHLQGIEDTIQIATHLIAPSVQILNKLENVLGLCDATIPEDLREKWSRDLQGFLHGSFILPARSGFLSRQNLEPIIRALEVTKSKLEVSAPAIYFLAAGATELLADSGASKGSPEWMKEVFSSVGQALRESDPRAVSIYTNILKQARAKHMTVRTEDLLSVCRTYALSEEFTDWKLVALVAQCDPDVFQVSEAGEKLLRDICDRSLDLRDSDEDKEFVMEVIDAMVKGFRTARNFSAFLKLWFEQLLRVGEKRIQSSPWSSIGQSGKIPSFDDSLIQQELSPRQLVDVLEWTKEQKTEPHALCLWLNTITQSISNEEFQDQIAGIIWGLILQVRDTSSPITSLQWTIISEAFAWLPLDERLDRWSEIKSSLTKILKKKEINSVETYQAFKCCCRIWISLLPDGEKADEVASIVEAFTARVSDLQYTNSKGLDTLLTGEPETGVLESVDNEHYMAWYIRGATRLPHIYFERTSQLPDVILALISQSKGDPSLIGSIWKTLLSNEHNLNQSKLTEKLVGLLVDGLRTSKKKKTWLSEGGSTILKTLSTAPLDAINRPQREQIMGLLVDDTALKRLSGSSSPDDWKLVLNLMTKLMKRPTFYEGMCFQHLINFADSLSDSLSGISEEHVVFLELVERYDLMVSATLRQMAEHVEDRSLQYFSDSSEFTKKTQNTDHKGLKAFRLTLLKALVTELGQSPNCRSHSELALLLESARQALSECVFSVLSDWLEDKKLFSKPRASSNLVLFAALDAAGSRIELSKLGDHKASAWKKLAKRSDDALQAGDMRGVKLQTFLWRYLAQELDLPKPTVFPELEVSTTKFREGLLVDYAEAISTGMDPEAKMQYLKALISEYLGGADASGQLVAIHHIVEQLLNVQNMQNPGDFDLSTAHSELTHSLQTSSSKTNAVYTCRILYLMLERRPQTISQWNVEALLSTIAVLASPNTSGTVVSFPWLCKLVEIIIKKHRLRIEGHYHILLNVLQALLQELVLGQNDLDNQNRQTLEPNAHVYTRLITLVCEPTAGAASRSQHHSALDSATDAAKRSAGRHMYLVLMQYVKLQLETDVPRNMRDALEPAMNSIFDITPPEGRKILNDAMDASGRAILREMFKRYSKFGKWSGI